MLMAYVSRLALLDRPTEDGSTHRAHWEESARLGNAVAAKQLELPPFPTALTYLYDWWVELSNARGEGMAGPAPLTYRDIEAWARMTDRTPERHEVEALLALDRAWRQAGHGDAMTDANEPDVAPVTKAWPTKPQPSVPSEVA